MRQKLSLEEIEQLVKNALVDPENIIKMIKKHGKRALGSSCLRDEQLHLDFDVRDNNTWNNDIINLFPLKRPVVITSWKGCLYAHWLDETTDYTCKGTREIIEDILAKYIDDDKARKMIEAYNK